MRAGYEPDSVSPLGRTEPLPGSLPGRLRNRELKPYSDLGESVLVQKLWHSPCW